MYQNFSNINQEHYVPVYIHNLLPRPRIRVLIQRDLFLEYVKRIYRYKIRQYRRKINKIMRIWTEDENPFFFLVVPTKTRGLVEKIAVYRLCLLFSGGFGYITTITTRDKYFPFHIHKIYGGSDHFCICGIIRLCVYVCVRMEWGGCGWGRVCTVGLGER